MPLRMKYKTEDLRIAFIVLTARQIRIHVSAIVKLSNVYIRSFFARQ